jgi:hypothetical protein
MFGVSSAYNFQTGIKKIKLLTEYESVTKNVLFSNAVLASLISERKYDVVTKNGHGNPGNNLESPCIISTQNEHDTLNIKYCSPIRNLRYKLNSCNV